MVFETQEAMDGYANNFYSKEMEVYPVGLTSATRNVKRLVVDIHFANHICSKNSAEEQGYWAGRWWGIARQIEIDLGSLKPHNKNEELV